MRGAISERQLVPESSVSSLFFLSPRRWTRTPSPPSYLRRPVELGHRTGAVRLVSTSSTRLRQWFKANHCRLAVRSPCRFDCIELELPPPAISWPDTGLGLKTSTRITIPPKELIHFVPGKENFEFEILGFRVQFGGFKF